MSYTYYLAHRTLRILTTQPYGTKSSNYHDIVLSEFIITNIPEIYTYFTRFQTLPGHSSRTSICLSEHT